jgi:hypothetical protein
VRAGSDGKPKVAVAFDGYDSSGRRAEQLLIGERDCVARNVLEGLERKSLCRGKSSELGRFAHHIAGDQGEVGADASLGGAKFRGRNKPGRQQMPEAIDFGAGRQDGPDGRCLRCRGTNGPQESERSVRFHAPPGILDISPPQDARPKKRQTALI